MRIRILLFAGLRERAGRGELEVELEEGASLEEARGELARRHPGILEGSRAAAAVNGAYERDARRPLREGDEVAFLPPVSGG